MHSHRGRSKSTWAFPLAGRAASLRCCSVSNAAFYRCEVKVISRSAGRSVTAAAAYRSAELVHDRRTGDDHDYRRRQGVEHSEIFLPENAPEELQDRSALWNAAEEAERRMNARVAREVLVSMPNELDQAEQRVSLARSMAQWLVGHYGVGADLAVHAPDRQADERNYHAHILITTRQIEQDGFGAKTRELDDKAMGPEEIERIRAQWEAIGNHHLDRAGHDPSLDRRSLKDRGIDREAQPKLGPVATEMERAGRRSNAGDDLRAVKERNTELERLKAERKVIDLAIERARRMEQTLEPSQTPAQARPERRPALNPELFRNQTQARQHAEQGRQYAKTEQERRGLERLLEYQHGESQRERQAELDQLNQAQEQRTRLAAWWANLTGRAEQERQQAAALQATLDNIEMRKAEAVSNLERQHQMQAQAMEQRHELERSQVEAQISSYQNPIANDQVQEPFQQAVNGPEPGMETTPEPSHESAINREFSEVSRDAGIGHELEQGADVEQADISSDMGDDGPSYSR